MFTTDRQTVLAALKVIGRMHCLYGGPWPDNRCDCKYGLGEAYAKLPEREGAGAHFMPKTAGLYDIRLGEKSGCPELRCLYEIIDSLSDEQYNATLNGLGHIGLPDLYGKIFESEDDESSDV